ncbi:hypothetical protein [Pseudokineococcus sp. 1T1Z-3]|uniref:hypothetical protein n=1 Tax=Pseudokineococcus sp. 1T1Z-3 TaxID=3132745 RepID=UPI0030A18808
MTLPPDERDPLAEAADELAALAAQGQADVEQPTGPDARPAGSDVQAGSAGEAAPAGDVPGTSDDVSPGPDVEATPPA